MYLGMRGMLLLFFSVLFTLNYCSCGDLIADTCKKTKYPNLCISTLRSNPDSKTADVEGLVRIILKVMLARANAILNQVNDLLKKTKDRGLKQSLTICASLYGEALYDIPEAIQNVGKNNPQAGSATYGVFDVADTCEDQFDESPITAENDLIKQLTLVAVEIINSLG